MNNATITEVVADEFGYKFQVKLNGTVYGTYKTSEEANKIAESFKGTLAN